MASRAVETGILRTMYSNLVQWQSNFVRSVIIIIYDFSSFQRTMLRHSEIILNDSNIIVNANRKRGFEVVIPMNHLFGKIDSIYGGIVCRSF